MDLIVTVSGVVLVAVSVKLVALVTEVATVSFGGMPGPEITVPAESDLGVAVVTVVLPAAVLAVKVVVPLVVFAMIVDDKPVLLIQGLLELWQCTQKVALVEALYWVVPRLG